MITKRTRDYQSKMSRRAFFLGGVQAALIGGIAARLYYLQVVQGSQYTKLSDRNKYDFRIIPPSRGRLYDAEGRLLAGNAEAYELSIIPDYAGDVPKVLDVLSSLIELTDEEIAQVLEEASDQPSFLPVPIRSDLTQREVSRLVVRSPELPGVNFDRIQKRIYPQGMIAGHLTGYVNRVTKDEIKDGLINRELANLSIGKSGAEKALEDNLRGRPGRERVLVNALGRPIRSFVDEKPAPGRDVSLSIDMDLQLQALKALKVGRHNVLNRGSRRVRQAIEADPVLASIVEPDE
ncbi:MAG: penicillin-binding protein 2, partial [Candidatus Puniceispirillales bacterium]